MPYIKVKAHPRDDKTKQKLAEAINEAVISIFGCQPKAVSISIEDVEPSNWDEVRNNEIYPNKDKMLIVEGEKKY